MPLIQPKIQLHAQTSVVVIKCAQNKKSGKRKKASKLQKQIWQAVKFDWCSKPPQISAHPESCSHSQGVNQWVLPVPEWGCLRLNRTVVYGTSSTLTLPPPRLRAAGALEALHRWSELGLGLMWPLPRKLLAWGRGEMQSEAADRPRHYGLRNAPREGRNDGKSCSCLQPNTASFWFGLGWFFLRGVGLRGLTMGGLSLYVFFLTPRVTAQQSLKYGLVSSQTKDFGIVSRSTQTNKWTQVDLKFGQEIWGGGGCCSLFSFFGAVGRRVLFFVCFLFFLSF